MQLSFKRSQSFDNPKSKQLDLGFEEFMQGGKCPDRAFVLIYNVKCVD